MNWKKKAFIQRQIGKLPETLSNKMYYYIQKRYGQLRKGTVDIARMTAILNLLKKLKSYGYGIKGKTFFEVGTGWTPVFSILVYLCGGKTVTVDKTKWLQKELTRNFLFFINKNKTQIGEIFDDLLEEENFYLLMDYINNESINVKSLLQLCQIQYKAPCDASKTYLEPNSIDYHFSYSVYQYIPFPILKNILLEGNRIVKNDGIFISNILYRDEYSGIDKRISPINFLQYSDEEWKKYAGHKFNSTNRARHDDYENLFKEVGHVLLDVQTRKDESILNIINGDTFKLNDKFKNKSNEVLVIDMANFFAKKK